MVMAKKPKKWMQKAVNPEMRGAFTAKAKAAGLSVAAMAEKTLTAGSKASTKTKRQAAFAKTARKIAKRK